MIKLFILFFIAMLSVCCNAQIKPDSSIFINNMLINADAVVIRSTPNYKKLIQVLTDDTSFYKAFKNLRLVNFTSNNNMQFYNSEGMAEASIINTVQQTRKNNCRNNTFITEQITGKPYNTKKEPNYITLQMFESLFFSRKEICNETNTVGNFSLNVKNKTGIEKHKDQLKMLFFNTGQDIPGIPFMAKKIALFKERSAKYYDFNLEVVNKNGVTCYLFSVVAKQNLSPSEKDDIVINDMQTWLNYTDYTIVSRNYNLSYNAAVYDFDVTMKIDMEKINNLLYPTKLFYEGNFKVAFKDRERVTVNTSIGNIVGQ